MVSEAPIKISRAGSLTHSENYKTAAVRSAYVEGRTEIRERLDIPESTLRVWIKRISVWCDLCYTQLNESKGDNGRNEGSGAVWENIEEGTSFVCIDCSMRTEKLRNNYN